MKNAAIIIISCAVTWFVTKYSSGDKEQEVVLENIQQDTLLAKITQTQDSLSTVIQGGDKKVIEKVVKITKTITTLKEKVNELTQTVNILTNENKILKNENKILKSVNSNNSLINGEPVDFSPIKGKGG